jgi:D-tyrosyl-tRNA(Tyr) deacylase
MRVVAQRVSTAKVKVDGRVVGAVGEGLLLLVGAGEGDSAQAAQWLADRCAHLRIFEDEDRRMNRSLVDIQGEALVVSQFTLYGDCRKGRRPSFSEALKPEAARALVDLFAESLRTAGVKVATGEFGARMEVELVNSGPVTMLLQYP